ncbi:MAG: 16S rRNA (guanine(527)-N(7))-methyltransferase RsmG [Deltaproteobacteria bacterium]|nr:16S rRNA (guanine(527)-N(7))-methyltransferase RsmG [Deltaproteobacteria bacterium]
MASRAYSAPWLLVQAAQAGLDLNPGQAERLATLTRLLLLWSDRINLIGPQAKARLWEEHLAEGLALAARLPQAERTADLGAGAGLPGLVVACLQPERSLDLFEARAKKGSFLRTAVAELGLDHVRVLTVRAPVTAPPQTQAAYDLVFSRAAASLVRLLKPAGWLLRPGGRLAALKGPRAEEELQTARRSPSFSSWRVESVVEWSLFGRSRRLVILEKT